LELAGGLGALAAWSAFSGRPPFFHRLFTENCANLGGISSEVTILRDFAF
jgi:hypothetical protein